jgi:zinc transporter ZupT
MRRVGPQKRRISGRHFYFLLKFLFNIVRMRSKSETRILMQELLTAITYPIVWLICSYLLKIESGLAKLLISLTASILVYVLAGMKISQKERKKG